MKEDTSTAEDYAGMATSSIGAEKEIRALFNSKHTHIFVAAFKVFVESGHEDTEYGKFPELFVNGGNKTEIDGKSWELMEIDRSTRDTSVVHGKINYLVALVEQYAKEVRKAA